MVETRPYSPMATSMLRSGTPAWGIILTLLWSLITDTVALFYSGTPVQRVGMLTAIQLFIVIFGLVVFLNKS